MCVVDEKSIGCVRLCRFVKNIDFEQLFHRSVWLIGAEYNILFSVFMIGGDGTYHFKVLVPSVAAGAIIGKGGETIAQLQKDTGARVKMSKSHDFYPGKSFFLHYVTKFLSILHSYNYSSCEF